MNEEHSPNYSHGRAVKICPSCGAENGPRTNFCAHCGAKLPNGRCHCPDCGRTYADDTAYCTNCGAKTVPGDPPQRTREYYDTYEYRENNIRKRLAGRLAALRPRRSVRRSQILCRENWNRHSLAYHRRLLPCWLDSRYCHDSQRQFYRR